MKIMSMLSVAVANVLLSCSPLAASDVAKDGWLVLSDDLSAFQEPTGEWFIAGDARLDARNDQRLAGEPGRGALINGKSRVTDNLITRKQWGDVEISLEFMIPPGSNSGVKLQGVYEVQIADSWKVAKPTGSDCGGIYPRAELTPQYHCIDAGVSPRVNAAKAPGQWQTLDIVFRAPCFDKSGRKVSNARFEKVTLNGKLIHDNIEVAHPSGHLWRESEHAIGPLSLQADHGPVAFRNVRLRPLARSSIPCVTLAAASNPLFGFGVEKIITVPNSPADLADTSIQANLPDTVHGKAKSLPAGQGTGPTEDAHLLIRFDNLPKLQAGDIKRIRLGLFREWKGDSYWDKDDFLLMVLPAPRPFAEDILTWAAASRDPEPNNAMGEVKAKKLGAVSGISGLYLTRNAEGKGEYKWADITNIARGWFDGTRPNNGLLTVTDYHRSRPWEGSAQLTSNKGPESQRPILEITYVVRPDAAKTPQYAVVYPKKAPLQERTAAWELATHLREATAEWYEPVEENTFDGKRSAIYVGWTRYALSKGYRPSNLPDGAFEIGAVDNNIILCGSRPRGSLYAVAEYLEGMCGFRWFTFQGEVRVPSLKKLPVPSERKGYAPAFASRDFFPPCPFAPAIGWTMDPSLKSTASLAASDRWMAMNRINGNTMAVHHPLLAMPSEKYGGFYEPYMNGVAHTFPAYIDPVTYFQNHPEWFGRYPDGSRSTQGLCFANRGMREKFLLALCEDIRNTGDDGIYSISPPDGGSVCGCPECKSMNDKHGAPTAAYVDFVNYLGRSIAAEFPKVRLEILAYGGFAEPPRDMVCKPNVLVRYAPIYKLQWDRLDFLGNKSQVEFLKGWLKVDPRQLRIWDYPHHYGDDAPIYPVARTDRGGRGVLEWVKKAAADRNVAQAGLCITMADGTGGKHYVSLDGGMNMLVSFPVIRKPTLIVSCRTNQGLEKVELPAASVVRVSSDVPDATPPVQTQGTLRAVQVTGNPKSRGLKSFVYLRFDLSALTPGMQIVDASFELSKNGEEDVKEDGTFAVYTVRPGATWDSATTWNTRPDVKAVCAFTLPACKGRQGFQKYDALFPQPNIFVLLENLRIYRNMGVKGMSMETDAGLLDQQCMADLVYWVLARGMWDAARTPDELVMDFCTSYYGKAGAEVFNYLKLLDKAYSQDPVKIPMHPGYMPRQTFFSYQFARDAQRIFDRAAAQVTQEPEAAERVLRARAPLDIATLFYFNRFNAEYRSSRSSPEAFAFDREMLEQRYTTSRLTMIDRFYPRVNRDTEIEAIGRMCSAAEQMPNSW